MRIKLKKYKLNILSIFLVTGVSISGWALASHYDNKGISAESQKELKSDIQVANVMPLALDRNNIILMLVGTGLIGFFGVRRQSKTLENFVKVKHPKSRAHANCLTENNPES